MMLCAMSRAAKPRKVLVGTIPRLACVTVRRSRKSAQSMRAMDNANRVLLAQALVMRNGLRGSASSIVNRFVSNAVELMFPVGALSLCGLVVVVVATVFSRLWLNTTELTRGGLRPRFLFMMRRASSAVGVETVVLSSAVTGRLRRLCGRLLDFVVLLQ